MTDDDLAKVARERYRINGTRVEYLLDGEWVVSGYCSSPEAAAKGLERRIQQAVRYSKMTPDERMRSILR